METISRIMKSFLKRSRADKHTLVFVLLMITSVSCEQFVKIDPPKTQLINTVVFENDATATAALVGIYSKIMGSTASTFGSGRITLVGGLSADELTDFSNDPDQVAVNKNSLQASNNSVTTLWNFAYQNIYTTNSVLEGLTNSTGVTPLVSQQLQGEAKFLRAFFHFYLTNLFGDVPYIKTTDYSTNAVVGRTPQAEVYQQIITDLLDAQSLLTDAYATADRVRPNKSTATALLARAYLYTQDWANAELQAATIINSGTYTLVINPANVFLKNSSEAIWQLLPIISGDNTIEGLTFIPTTGSTPSNVGVTDSLRNAFEALDSRKTSWIGSTTVAGVTYYFPYKYKVKAAAAITEYYMVFRLAEQYLIRAEAAAQQNDIAQAVSDLNVIRSRAGLSALSSSITQAQCLAAVAKERRIELCAEWGHRWFDIKRTGRADAVLGPIKSAWKSTAALFPIPQTQLANDQTMTQNPGY
jgi:hypothetical protein